MLYIATTCYDYGMLIMKFCLMKNSGEYALPQSHNQSIENTFGEANFDFISNFFIAKDGSYKQWEMNWKELQALTQLESQSTNSIVLTDSQLERWLKTKDKNGYLSVGPYEVNHILLHAIMVPMAQWSDNFTLYLTELAKWLLHPGDEDENLRAFTKSYPGNLLANMYFLSLVRLNIDIKTREEIISDPIYEGGGAVYSWVENSLFIEALELSNEQFNYHQKIETINLLKGYFGVMVSTEYELKQLGAIPKEQLDDTQQEIIYQELKDKFSEEFGHNTRLQCSSRLFPQEQRKNQDNRDSYTLMKPT